MANSNQTVYRLGAAGVSVHLIKANPNRKGLLLFNPNDGIINPAYPLLICLNDDLPAFYGIPLQANEKWFMDFVTPNDDVYVTCPSAANALAGFIEFGDPTK